MNVLEKNEVGAWGEDYAKTYLENQGYVVLETNWRSSHLEVDIIAQDKETVVFVEVKTRTTTFKNPIEAVNKQKQRFLISAANSYVRQKKLDCEVRFDIVSIIKDRGNLITMEHIKNAFYPSMR
ncbi:MAG: YraN family protein [Bacteroidales bacterium]|nr:YraN family protein [Bacteroidales bacterium]